MAEALARSHARRMKLLACSVLFVLACGGSGDPPDTDALPRDGGVDGSADSGADGGAADGGSDAGADGGAADGGAADGGAADGGAADGGSDAGDCEYIDLDIYIVDCAEGYTYLRRWQRLGGSEAECPDYYTLGGTRFDGLDDAIASASCDSECLRRAGTSVSLIRCGHRSGYIVYRDAEPESCGEVYETPDGLFPSIEAWDEAAPCE